MLRSSGKQGDVPAMGVLNARSRHPGSVSCSRPTPFWKLNLGPVGETSLQRRLVACRTPLLAYGHNKSVVQSGKLPHERHCCWRERRCEFCVRNHEGKRDTNQRKNKAVYGTFTIVCRSFKDGLLGCRH